MRYFDISMNISEDMMVYKNLEVKRPKREITAEYKNKEINESQMLINLHTGTHIDAPFHMIDHGETIEKIDIDKLIGNAVVLDLTSVVDGIGKEHLIDKDIKRDAFVLLKTKTHLIKALIPVSFILKRTEHNT